MDGRDLDLTNCSAALPYGVSCFQEIEPAFSKNIQREVWQLDVLLITEVVLAGIIIGIGAKGHRYRQHPFTRFIFLGANTLFLPIISSVLSSIPNSTTPNYIERVNFKIPYYGPHYAPGDGLYGLVAECDAGNHYNAVVLCALLLQIVMVNTSTIAATEGRERRRSIGPPINLIVQVIWTIYLGFTFMVPNLVDFHADRGYVIIVITPFILLCAKIVLKYYAFEKAQRSFALGRNPGLTFAYMEKLRLQEANQQKKPPICSDSPPPLLVMGEDEKEVEIQHCGYAFKDDSWTGLRNNLGLVTFDRIWQLDNNPPISTPQLKDLCFSFALLKLLRCRFARYQLTNVGSMRTLTFLRRLSLQSGKHDMIFRVIGDELSFVHDYYYSSLPISYAKCSLPILNTLLSLLTIGYCIMLAVYLIYGLIYTPIKGADKAIITVLIKQLYCKIWWINGHSVDGYTNKGFGSIFIDQMLLILLPVLVLMTEVREVASYICSNWTKVALFCHYVNHNTSQHSLCIKKWAISLLLRCRCKLIMKHWNEEMSQCSILVLHKRTTTTVTRLLNYLPDRKWKVRVTVGMKICIINALRSVINGSLGKGVASLRRSQVGERFLWACDGKGTSGTILVWHIATSIVQVRHPSLGKASDSDHMTVATQLSLYCAYLVSWCPQLLPDNNAWSTSLYKDVKKDAEGALAGYSLIGPTSLEDEHAIYDYSVAVEAKAESSIAEDEHAFSEHPVSNQSSRREDGYQKLVRLLSENSKHEVVKDGVKLGKQLAETIEDKETMWKLLAEFWSEMLLYLAPSDNLKGHSDAIARGGELITLLWALLFHVGIISRPGEDDDTAATSAGVV